MRKAGYFLVMILLAMPLYANNVKKGAELYRENCLGCHSVSYLSYERLQQDLELKALFPFQKGAIMTALPPKDALSWFGREPPELSLIAREKGEKWLKAYLQGFYRDKEQPFGVNNHILQETKMPWVLDKNALTAENIGDLVEFLKYSAEPSRSERYALGVKVLIYWILFVLLIFLLYRTVGRALARQ